MAETDPLTLVYEALWALLEAHPAFGGMVKDGNRIKYTGASGLKNKDVVSTVDLPEVRLAPLHTEPHLQRTSSGSSIRKTFGIEVQTGDRRVDEILFPLEWEIYRALSKWATTLSALTWKDKPFVKLCQALPADETLERRLTRGIAGWHLVWACEVELWFTTADLQAEEV